MATKHDPIELRSSETIKPLRVYRIRGGYRLIVTAERAIWQEFDGRYAKLATGQTWRDRCPLDDTINRRNACLVANFWGI
jgi:hypothetical protein